MTTSTPFPRCLSNEYIFEFHDDIARQNRPTRARMGPGAGATDEGLAQPVTPTPRPTPITNHPPPSNHHRIIIAFHDEPACQNRPRRARMGPGAVAERLAVVAQCCCMHNTIGAEALAEQQRSLRRSSGPLSGPLLAIKNDGIWDSVHYTLTLREATGHAHFLSKGYHRDRHSLCPACPPTNE
jgi:hypothetical protein